MKTLLLLGLLSNFVPDYEADPQYYYQAEDTLTRGEANGIGLLIVAALSLIIALAVVGSMKAKLKTARHRQDADDYIRRNSLSLIVREDRFLYQTESRRRIETRSQPQGRGPIQKGR